jgi:hypothetical protein
MQQLKEKQKTKQRPLRITEEESLILWKLLERQYHSCQQEFSHNDITLLFAKIQHFACKIAGTLDEGETVKTLYQDMM